VNEELLQAQFAIASTSQAPKEVQKVAAVALKPMLWMDTEKQTAVQVRNKVAIASMKVKGFHVVLDVLRAGRLLQVIEEAKFAPSVLMLLAGVLNSIQPEEWVRLRNVDSPNSYLWDPAVEGFYHGSIPLLLICLEL